MQMIHCELGDDGDILFALRALSKSRSVSELSTKSSLEMPKGAFDLHVSIGSVGYGRCGRSSPVRAGRSRVS